MKLVFFGTPEVSRKFLEELHKEHEICAVVCQPDKPAKRGFHLQEPPVKTFAKEKAITVFQPEKFDPETAGELKKLGADVGVVISYGKLIPKDAFTAPSFGCFNIHFSLLPKYRGAAPVQWALINGENETGVTTFWLEETLDTGPLLVQEKTEILPQDDAVTLMDRLTLIGIRAMNATLDRIRKGQCAGAPQKGAATFARSLKKSDGKIDWSKPAAEIVNLVRGTKPWPGAYFHVGKGRNGNGTVKVIKAVVADEVPREGAGPGTVVSVKNPRGFTVKCGSGSLIVEEVHPENRKAMDARAFVQGSRLSVGDALR
ncbi:MAG: methionyl-tRNA formyltransferase [Endomicrobiales bacterium]|nr:methionyl-tRNA formyltransferase [Endomicrobiales bacterium]